MKKQIKRNEEAITVRENECSNFKWDLMAFHFSMQIKTQGEDSLFGEVARKQSVKIEYPRLN